MDVGSVSDTAQISWKQIAVQKQERLRTGAEGEPIKEMVRRSYLYCIPKKVTINQNDPLVVGPPETVKKSLYKYLAVPVTFILP